MTHCRICGRSFDSRRFQVVVPGLEEGFDSVECAERARSLAGPAAAAAPPAEVFRPLPTPASEPALAAALGLRKPLFVGANLALLAAGTAATVYLWARVFGADPSGLQLSGLSAISAYERATVPSELAPSAPASRPGQEPGAGATLSPLVPAEGTGAGTAPGSSPPILVSEPTGPAGDGGSPGGGDGGGGNGGGTGGGGGGTGGGGGGPAVGPDPGSEPGGPKPIPGRDDDEDDDEDNHDDDEDDGRDDEDSDGEHKGRGNGHEKAHGKGHHKGNGEGHYESGGGDDRDGSARGKGHKKKNDHGKHD